MADPFQRFSGKRALVMGLGLMGGGVEAVRFLHRYGAKVLATDTRDAKTLAPSVEALKDIPVEYRLGEHRDEDFKHAEVVIHSPAVRPDHKLLELARANGAEVTQEMSLFIEACPAWNTVGVTGSNGKTTTTALAYEMFRQTYKPAQDSLWKKWADEKDPEGVAEASAEPKSYKGGKLWLGGNMGTPLINLLDEIQEDDVVLLELSSFQLMDWHRIKRGCRRGVITNITPNHLDWHRDFAEYSWAKQAICPEWNSTEDLHGFFEEPPQFLINADDPECARIAAQNPERYHLFSTTRPVFTPPSPLLEDKIQPERGDISVSGLGGELKACVSVVWDPGDPPHPGTVAWAKRSDLRLPGDFNWANAVAAAAAVIGDWTARHDLSFLGRATRNFRGVEHRLEPCGETHGAKIYNDSIATDPTATLAALSVFESGIHLILGGASDKGAGYDKLAQRIVTHGGIKSLYLQGPTAANIKRALEHANQSPERKRAGHTPPILEFPTFESACRAAIKAARQGDVVLMSPASTSFYEHAPGEKFGNFEERGRFFKELVQSLAAR